MNKIKKYFELMNQLKVDKIPFSVLFGIHLVNKDDFNDESFNLINGDVIDDLGDSLIIFNNCNFNEYIGADIDYSRIYTRTYRTPYLTNYSRFIYVDYNSKEYILCDFESFIKSLTEFNLLVKDYELNNIVLSTEYDNRLHYKNNPFIVGILDNDSIITYYRNSKNFLIYNYQIFKVGDVIKYKDCPRLFKINVNDTPADTKFFKSLLRDDNTIVIDSIPTLKYITYRFKRTYDVKIKEERERR